MGKETRTYTERKGYFRAYNQGSKYIRLPGRWQPERKLKELRAKLGQQDGMEYSAVGSVMQLIDRFLDKG